MRWSERAICFMHGTDDERDANSQANDIYERTLVDWSGSE
jgi:hypothetical protein